MKRKYFFFDIDGTLTNLETRELVLSALKTIERLQKAGHFVAIASGRAYYKTKDVASQAHIHNIVCNGGAGIVLNDKLVKNEPLDRKKALALLDEANRLNLGTLVAFDDSIDVFMNDERFIRQVGLRQEPTRYYYDPNKSYDTIKDIYKIYLAINLEDEDKLTLRDTLGHVRFGDGYLTYQHDKKDQGIKDMLELVGGKDEDVFVFGDAENDMVMFRDEWYKVALKSHATGNDLLRSKADYVSDYAENDGIYKACKKLGFID